MKREHVTDINSESKHHTSRRDDNDKESVDDPSKPNTVSSRLRLDKSVALHRTFFSPYNSKQSVQ